MASTHFKKLDEESRALVERWDQIARVTALVAVVAATVWAACAGLRWLVHHASEWILETSEHGWIGGFILLIVLLGGSLIRMYLYQFREWAEVAGDGMELALENYQITYVYEGDDPGPRYERPAFILAIRKAIATFLTLGTGASGGLEAPAVVIAEALSSGVSRVLNVRSEAELRTYQLAGVAAAVATLLGAPFTAALFAAEVAYGDRIIYRKLVYGLWAGVIAYWCDLWLRGSYEPIFGSPTHEPEYRVAEWAGAALVAVAVSGPLALGFGRAVLWIRALVARAGPPWLGSVSVVIAGLLALTVYHTLGIAPHHLLGMGEETVDGILTHESRLNTAPMLAVVLVGRVITTVLTITSGGSAGLLVPSMVLGGVSGALTAHVMNLTGWVALDPALFAVVGIASSLVAVVGVPLAAIALVFEVFGRVFGPPAILACGLTYLVTLKFKVYEAQHGHPDDEHEATSVPTSGLSVPPQAVESGTKAVESASDKPVEPDGQNEASSPFAIDPLGTHHDLRVQQALAATDHMGTPALDHPGSASSEATPSSPSTASNSGQSTSEQHQSASSNDGVDDQREDAHEDNDGRERDSRSS